MDMTRVSCCTIPLIDRPLEQALRVISEAGFKRIDLLGRLPHLSLDPVECDPAAVLAATEAHGLAIANLGTYPGSAFASPERADQEMELLLVHRAIDLAVLFGARSIRVRVGNDDPQCSDRIVPWFHEAAVYAADKSVYMGFENHGGGISGQPELCAELAEKVGSEFFGALYEPCNLMTAGVDYRWALDVMGDHIVHVHFKDAEITGEGFEHTMIGQGQIDFPWIVERLDALGYDGTYALEYEIRSQEPETGLREWYEAFAAMK